MKILDLVKAFQSVPVFSVLDIEKSFPGFETENLLNWQRKGYLVRVRNGWYSLSGTVRSRQDLYYVANRIYHPSYLSLETALSHYGWIPEGVFSFSSVTTRKTQAFESPLGAFFYRSLKPSLYFGYKILAVGGLNIRIAEPEKTILDFFYFRSDIRDMEDLASFRFNIFDMKQTLDMVKLADYASLFQSRSLDKKVELLETAFKNGELL
jgi:predicted transcriptional regulator of viral defense system